MRVNLISDLHLEVADLVLPGGDILVIAGDACVARDYKPHLYEPGTNFYDEDDLKRPDRVPRFFAEECAKYNQVIYVMGNHEHYHGKLHNTYNTLKANLPDNVALLERETFEYQDVLFVGGTLWTDAHNRDPITEMTIRNGMNDYHMITKWTGGNHYRKLHPRDTIDEHDKTRKYIELVIEQNRDKKVVVVTHHAPTAMSIDPEFRRDHHMNGAYFTRLDDVILNNVNIKVWCHGHTHVKHDYMVGQCRVLCNPRGYYGYERTEFNPEFAFEV